VKPYGRLIHGKDPRVDYVLDLSEVIVGRSETCDIRLDDPYVSRRQARIIKDGDQVIIQNIGSNPILVNAEPIDRSHLEDGDMILIGKTQLVFRLESPSEAAFGDQTPDGLERDVEMTALFEAPGTLLDQGPRLVIVDADGDTRIFPLIDAVTVLGRAHDADIRLADAAVSRKHARIEKRGDEYHLVRMSRTNPLFLNRTEVTDRRLYAGDDISIGPFKITFMSDREEDRRPSPERIVVKGRRGTVLAWACLALATVSAAAYFGFHSLYTPWKHERELQDIVRLWDAGETADVQSRLNRLLSESLPESTREAALDLLAKLTIAEADQLTPEGRFAEARSVLNDFIVKYGAEKSAEAVQARLDQLRLQYGQQLEIGGDPMGALREFSSITEDSPFFDEAQRALSHIWRVYQKENVTELPLEQLMARADEHFAAKRYTTPIGQNAYAIYQTILALDPDNRIAKRRIEEMKDFYREAGRKYAEQKNCAVAMVYFERYLLISPDDEEVKEMMRACRKPRAAPDRRRRTGSVAVQEDSSRERVERMLQETENP